MLPSDIEAILRDLTDRGYPVVSVEEEGGIVRLIIEIPAMPLASS